jgi:predicted phosphohydrolase
MSMRIVLISDTHCLHNVLTMPHGDIIIHSGDYSLEGTIAETGAFFNWFQNLPYKHKILIDGNHERNHEKEYALFKSMIPENVIYLENSGIKVEGLKIWGSPNTPAFKNWGYMYHTEDEAKRLWGMIPDKLDILITHGPPYKMMDFSTYEAEDRTDQHVGCKILRKAVDDIKPNLHVFGHVHGQTGYKKQGKTLFVNAAILGEGKLMPENVSPNVPIVVDSKTWKVIEG